MLFALTIQARGRKVHSFVQIQRMKVVLASNNAHKLDEIRAALQGSPLEIISLDEAGIHDELPETTGTIPGNALQKATFVFEKYGIACLADDSGLMVEALDGRPGVDSAHYSGSREAGANINKVLAELQGKTNRNAVFITVLAYKSNDSELIFEGKVEGSIIENPIGINGFGYDPIFMPTSHERTFAEMSAEEKISMSHRTRAIQKFLAHINLHGLR